MAFFSSPNWFDSRRVFNQGLPEQFGFVTTFRSKKDARSRWHIIRITDARKNPQFAVALNPKRKTVELSLPKYDRTLQTLTWDVPQVNFFFFWCIVLFRFLYLIGYILKLPMPFWILNLEQGRKLRWKINPQTNTYFSYCEVQNNFEFFTQLAESSREAGIINYFSCSVPYLTYLSITKWHYIVFLFNLGIYQRMA